MSLFDEYPAKAIAGRTPKVCCAGLDAPEDVTERLWQYVHDMSHGRVTFSPATLAALAGVDEGAAGVAIDKALAAEWLTPAAPEVPGDQSNIYVGRLARKR